MKYKLRILLFSAFFAAGCSSTSVQSIRYNELPMYGGQDRQSIPELKAIDDAFIERVTKDLGGREKTSELWVEQGFRFYFQNDLATAMKRFNQGWLLNPKNPNVFHGYASILNDEQKFC